MQYLPRFEAARACTPVVKGAASLAHSLASLRDFTLDAAHSGRLRDPAVLVIAVVFLISAVGQAILQAWVGRQLSRDHRSIERPRDRCLWPRRSLSHPDATAKQTLRDHLVGAAQELAAITTRILGLILSAFVAKL